MCRAVFEPEAVVSGFKDVTVVGQAVEQRGRHLGIAKHAGPFTEAEIEDGFAVVVARLGSIERAIGIHDLRKSTPL